MMQGLACRRLAFVFSGDKTAGYPAGLATSSTRLAGSGGEDPQHNAASLTRVETPQPRQQLADPAAEASSLLERVQDVLRPASTRGHAYRWAEGSARAALREQQASCSGVPGVESMYARVEAVGDEATAPRSWHFSSRSDQLDERRQEELAEQKRRGASG